jgi:Rrf2 family transcriptional regulator, iron-sulfur cluster assembly transcription factor
MFQLSRQVDYAIQLVTRLAEVQEGESLSLKKFSTESNISFLFLQKIARALKAAGIIASRQGVQGGYYLVIPGDKLNLRQIIEAVEGPITAEECLKCEVRCGEEAHCSTRKVWNEVETNLTTLLEQTHIC